MCKVSSNDAIVMGIHGVDTAHLTTSIILFISLTTCNMKQWSNNIVSVSEIQKIKHTAHAHITYYV